MRKTNGKLLYRQRCYGKIRYTKREAETLVNFLKKKGERGLRIYECSDCSNGWHLTHKELIEDL